MFNETANNKDYNIDANTKFYQQGEASAREFVKSHTLPDGTISNIPFWDISPANEGEYYFRQGYKDEFKKLTRIDLDRANKPQKTKSKLGIFGGKKRPNCLDREIKTKGSNFIDKYSPERFYNEIKSLSDRIIRDLSNANINVAEYEEYFRDERLLSSLISVTAANRAFYEYSYNCGKLYEYACNSNMINLTPEDFDDVKNRYNLYYYANMEINSILYDSLIQFAQYSKGGVFSPDILNAVQDNIYRQKLNMNARNPYVRGRI